MNPEFGLAGVWRSEPFGAGEVCVVHGLGFRVEAGSCFRHGGCRMVAVHVAEFKVCIPGTGGCIFRFLS